MRRALLLLVLLAGCGTAPKGRAFEVGAGPPLAGPTVSGDGESPAVQRRVSP